MDSNETVVHPENELKKLQELVVKLEQQNEALRSNQAAKNLQVENRSIGDNNKPAISTNNNFDVDLLNHSNNLDDSLKEKLVLDDFDDVDFSCLPEEEDSWLYLPQTLSHAQQSKEPLMKWIRQDLDNPSPEVAASRRALIVKMNEVARLRHSSSSPVIASQPTYSKSATSLSRSTEENGVPNRQGLVRKPLGIGKLDSGTFTRPKKSSLSTAPQLGEGEPGLEVASAPNASDIENLAKLQEESLRQSVTPNRKAMRAKHHLLETDNGARLSPSRFDVDGAYVSQHRGSLGSENSTPPDSPHGNQQFQPNLSNVDSRSGHSLPSKPSLQYQTHNSSDSSLDRGSACSDETNLAPEAIRGRSSRLQGNYRSNVTVSSGKRRGIVTAMPKPGRPAPRVSPQRTSNLPGPRRQIARPTTGPRSSLPTFRRANIPSPMPSSSGGSEESWREGCF